MLEIDVGGGKRTTTPRAPVVPPKPKQTARASQPSAASPKSPQATGGGSSKPAATQPAPATKTAAPTPPRRIAGAHGLVDPGSTAAPGRPVSTSPPAPPSSTGGKAGSETKITASSGTRTIKRTHTVRTLARGAIDVSTQSLAPPTTAATGLTVVLPVYFSPPPPSSRAPRQPQRFAGSGRSSRERELAGLSLPNPLHLVTPFAAFVAHEVSKEKRRFIHAGAKAFQAAEKATVSAGVVVEHFAKRAGRFELNRTELEVKFGTDVADWVRENPATVAWITATAAIFAPPPADVALMALSATASAVAGSEAYRKGNYIEAALDVAAIGTGAEGGAARFAEKLAEAKHAGAVGDLRTFDEIADASSTDVPPLSDGRREALVSVLKNSTKQAGRARATARHADLETAFLTLVADPRVEAALEFHHR